MATGGAGRVHDGKVLQVCEVPGCATLTIGPRCAAHDRAVDPSRFPRGRPYRGAGVPEGGPGARSGERLAAARRGQPGTAAAVVACARGASR